MGKDCFIGVDIGTQGTRAALFAEGGERLAEASEASCLLHPVPGAVEEDAERQYASVCRTLRAIVEKSGIDPGRVGALAIDGQMAGVIGVGKDGLAVTPYDSWLDTRCSVQVDRMKSQAGLAVLEKLKPEALENPSVALYYGVLLSASGDAGKAAKYVGISQKAGLLPEERALADQAMNRAQPRG